MIKQINDSVFFVGVRDPDKKIFDEVVPLPNGTSYNSYLIKSEGVNVLIDTVEPKFFDEFLGNIKECGVEKINYIVSNHGEQDHSGCIPKLLELFPECKVITNVKCMGFLEELLDIDKERFFIIEGDEEFKVGSKTLKFILTPWVHWPETMSTLLVEDGILFSCDFFGSHYANFDLYVEDNELIYKAARRYYGEIMMPFRVAIRGNLKKLEPLDIKMIAPSHGPVYNDPTFIIDTYKEWVSDDVRKKVLIPYVSMHESTRSMAEYIAKRITDAGIEAKLFDLGADTSAEVAVESVDASTILFGAPCFLVGIHPKMYNVLYLLNAIRPKTKIVSMFGSYLWAGKFEQMFKDSITQYKPEIVDPIMIKGIIRDGDFKLIDDFCDVIIEKTNAL